MAYYGCIEAGGTKFVLGLLDEGRTVHARTRIDTRTPAETIPAAIDWFRGHGVPLEAIGIASFGPVRLDPQAPDWGHILATTKPGWSGADMAGPFARAFGCPVAFDTDVNGAALAESLWGAAQGADVAVYITIGTGVGGGVIVNGVPVHGLGHPEMGHASPPRHPDDLDFPGHCPFHGACYEGLASGPSIAARWGGSLSDLPPDHPGHDIIAFYLAHLAVSLSAFLAPRVIVLGGGVTGAPGLLARVRAEYRRIAADYMEPPAIVAPGLGDNAGLLGALALAVRRKAG
jgi:fructokinase